MLVLILYKNNVISIIIYRFNCYVKDSNFFYAHELLSRMSIFLSPSGSFEETPTNLYYWMIKQNGDS